MAKKANTNNGSKEPKKEESPYGRELQMGMIVRMKSSDVSFEEALAAGPDSAFEYFSDILQGLRLGHIKALRTLGFFDMVGDVLGISIDVGSWEEIKSDELEDFVKVIKKLRPQAETGIQEVLDDILEIVKIAIDQDCSIGFMLADEELMDIEDEDWGGEEPAGDPADWDEDFVPGTNDDDWEGGAGGFDEDAGGGHDDFDDFGGGSKKRKK